MESWTNCLKGFKWGLSDPIFYKFLYMILGKIMLINLTVKDVSVSYLSINVQNHNYLFIFSLIQLFCIALSTFSIKQT